MTSANSVQQRTMALGSSSGSFSKSHHPVEPRRVLLLLDLVDLCLPGDLDRDLERDLVLDLERDFDRDLDRSGAVAVDSAADVRDFNLPGDLDRAMPWLVGPSRDLEVARTAVVPALVHRQHRERCK